MENEYRKNDGRESLLSFGAYPAVSLEQARKMRDEAKTQRALGVDPGIARQEEKTERTRLARNTFEAVTREWMDIHSTKIKPQSMHIYAVLLDKFVFPLIGKRPIAQMKGPDFLELLRGIEAQGQLYSAKRIAIGCGMIMFYLSRFIIYTQSKIYYSKKNNTVFLIFSLVLSRFFIYACAKIGSTA